MTSLKHEDSLPGRVWFAPTRVARDAKVEAALVEARAMVVTCEGLVARFAVVDDVAREAAAFRMVTGWRGEVERLERVLDSPFSELLDGPAPRR